MVLSPGLLFCSLNNLNSFLMGHAFKTFSHFCLSLWEYLAGPPHEVISKT